MPFWVLQVCCMHLFPHLHILMISQQVETYNVTFCQSCFSNGLADVVRSNTLLQALTDIQGLEGCPNLSQLWLTENEISVIQGLDHCLQLRQLYLYSNHISYIEGLDNLTKLEVSLCTESSTSLALLHLHSLRVN